MYWLNGETLEKPSATFDLTDRGLLLGDGVFDTALVLGGKVFRGEAHLVRLFDALDSLWIDADKRAIRKAVASLSERCKSGVLRVTVTRGPGPRGLRPQNPQRATILASMAPVPFAALFAPVSLDIATIRRNETSPTARLKTLNYLDGVLAVGAAAAKGRDEALFLNCAGRVACAASGNIFMVCGNELVTPPVSDGVLPGIIRGIILTEYGGREHSIELADLLSADAVFMTNCVRLVAPILQIGETGFRAKESEVIASIQRRIWQAILSECSADLPFPPAGLAARIRGKADGADR